MERTRPGPAFPVAFLCVALVVALGCAQGGPRVPDPVAGLKPAGPLRILLTNDDGYASPGIRAVRSALLRSGHDVTLVGPSENRSGASSSITSRGDLELVEHEPGIFSVSGTPADSVRVGLDVLFRDAPPDLVVSGANFGENIGPAVLVSGTVGAALTAMSKGVPAIAISVGINIQEAREQPVMFPSTLAAFPGAADLTARIVRSLDTSRRIGQPVLPPRTILNINHPPLLPDRVAGVVYTGVGQAETFEFGYERKGPSTVSLVFRPAHGEEPVSNADTTQFARGFVTISVLDGDVLAGPARSTAIEMRTRSALPQAASLP